MKIGRFIVIILVGIIAADLYRVSLLNIYDFFTVVLTGEPAQAFKVEFWDTFVFPIVVVFVIYLTRLQTSPVLYPAFQLSLFMFWGTQIALAIVNKGFGDGSSLAQQATFLVLGLVGFIIARWGICHYFYQKYEVNKSVEV